MEKTYSRDEQEENDGEKGKDPQWVSPITFSSCQALPPLCLATTIKKKKKTLTTSVANGEIFKASCHYKLSYPSESKARGLK